MAESAFHAFIVACLKLIGALVPAALGAVIAQLLQKGVALRDRFIQVIVGIVVSYYVTLGLVAWLVLDPFVGQAVSFVLGMSAYQATPKLIASLSDAIARVPGLLTGRLGGRGDG